MKKTIFGLLAIISTTLFSDEVISIADLTADMMQEVTTGKGITFKIPEGTELSLEISIKGDFFACEQAEPLCVNVLRDLYVKWKGGDMQASADGKNWKHSSEFFTGSVDCSALSGNDGQTIEYSLSLDANQR